MPVATQLRTVQGSVRDVARTADVLAVPVHAGPEVDPAYARALAGVAAIGATDLLAHQEATGDPGEIVSAPIRLGDGITELLLFGVGDASPGALRTAGASVARRSRGRSGVVAGVPSRATEPGVTAFAEGVLLASYDFRIGTAPKRPGAESVALVTGRTAAVERGTVLAGAAALARDLANTPSLEKTPQWLADRAADIASEAGLAVRVRDEKELRAGGFGGLLAVGAGSARPPRLIELTYDPPGASEHLVLVGKGITFDSGGLSLKPSEGMKTMKTDMAGGAAVIGAMSGLRRLGVAAKVTGLVAAAENLPSGSSMRPGDVIRHYGGTTSEVLNTDAEGRLVLADALAYADAELAPTAVVDIATLTGAIKVALGLRLGALYATDDTLAATLIAAGEDSGEPLWRMPLTEDYREAIESDIADVANLGRGGFFGGSITAALFLREFVGTRPWAHLDVAGPARATSDDREISKGGTGYGARLLLNWLAARQPPG